MVDWKVYVCALRVPAGEGGGELAALGHNHLHLSLHGQEGAAAGALGQVRHTILL